MSGKPCCWALKSITGVLFLTPPQLTTVKVIMAWGPTPLPSHPLPTPDTRQEAGQLLGTCQELTTLQDTSVHLHCPPHTCPHVQMRTPGLEDLSDRVGGGAGGGQGWRGPEERPCWSRHQTRAWPVPDKNGAPWGQTGVSPLCSTLMPGLPSREADGCAHHPHRTQARGGRACDSPPLTLRGPC